MTTAQNPKDTPAKNYQPRMWPFIVLGGLFLLGSVAIVQYWVTHQPIKKPRPTATAMPFVNVSRISVSDHPVTISASGFVSATYTTSITPQVSGKIIQLSPKLLVGEHVKKGELLLQIDATNYQAALASAKNNLAQAQSSYQQAQGRARQAAQDVKRLGLKATPLSLQKPQLAAAKAAVENAKAQVSLAETNVGRTNITAPFNAVVQSTNASIGDIAGSGALATLAATDYYTVKLLIKSHELPFLAVGDRLTLTDTSNQTHVEGVINRFDAGFDKNNRTIGAYVDIKDPLQADQPLLLNSYLHANITGKVINNSAWIANNSIVNNQFVWQKDDKDIISPVTVRVMYRGQNQSLVTFEKPITWLIVQPQNTFFAGQQVTTKNRINRPAKQKKTTAEGDK